jgi:hypothetical protein
LPASTCSGSATPRSPRYTHCLSQGAKPSRRRRMRRARLIRNPSAMFRARLSLSLRRRRLPRPLLPLRSRSTTTVRSPCLPSTQTCATNARHKRAIC